MVCPTNLAAYTRQSPVENHTGMAVAAQSWRLRRNPLAGAIIPPQVWRR
jgi:hypothetical protein